MELVFHKENGLYITEFEVTSDFNVHLERSKGGKVSFYQKTTDGNYDHIEKLSKNIDKVFDYDFQALVYPKIIKITSECEFDVASLSTDGEVTEIKSQSKEVEIVSNGVTEIAPDAGFGYLSGVKVNVNVPQSGGSDTPSGGTLRFYSLTNPDNKTMAIEYLMPSFAKANGIIASAALLHAAGMWDSVSAVASDTAGKLYMDGKWDNLGELLDANAEFNKSFGYIEITEEEFYAI